MKNIKLFMCLASIAFSVPLWAQTPEPSASADTLIIRLDGRNQVFITGKSLRNVAGYKRADSLKTIFFTDLETALKSGSFPETPKRIHYFVSQQGKRRLKAELNEDVAAKLDLPYEKNRMVLDLPPLHFTVYDLAQNIEIHFFLEDLDATGIAANTSLNAAVEALEKDRKKHIGLSTYRLEKTGFGFESRNPSKTTHFSTEGQAYIGVLLLGSMPSPLVSYDFIFRITQQPRSGRTQFRFGFSYNGFIVSDFKDGRFQNINPGSYWHLLFQTNLGFERDNWFGITGGQFSTQEEIGLPKDALKFGLQANFDRDCFSFESINLEKFSWKFNFERRKQMYMFSYRRSIL